MTGLTRKHRSHLLKYRTYAFTIDLFAITLLNKAIINSYGMYLKTVFFHYTESKQLEILAGVDQVFLSVLLLLFISYFSLSYYLGQGQTPGKIICGIKIVDSNYKNPGLLMSIGRTLGYLTCYATGLFLFALPYFTKKGFGLQDWISKSMVVRNNSLLEPVAEVIPIPTHQDYDQDLAA